MDYLDKVLSLVPIRFSQLEVVLLSNFQNVGESVNVLRLVGEYGCFWRSIKIRERYEIGPNLTDTGCDIIIKVISTFRSAKYKE